MFGAELVEQRQHAVDHKVGDAAIHGRRDPPAAAVLHQFHGDVAVVVYRAVEEAEHLIGDRAADTFLDEPGEP